MAKAKNKDEWIYNNNCFGDIYEDLIKKIKQIGYKSEDDIENLADTPKRAARGLREMIWPKDIIQVELKKHVSKTFPAKSKDMVISANNFVTSYCPHHFIPVFYKVNLAYVPKKDGGKFLGLSKLSRIADIMAKQPILQEQYAANIADVLHKSAEEFEYPQIETLGSMAIVIGIHGCMACRGVKAPNVRVANSAVRGIFADPTKTTKSELVTMLQLMNANLKMI